MSLEGLLVNVFVHHIAPLLDGRDASYLRAVSTTCKNLVDSSKYLTRRRKQHYIWLDDPECIKDLTAEDITLVTSVPYHEFAFILGRKPMVENVMLIQSTQKRKHWLITNHYESHSSYRDSTWDDAPDNVILLEFKTLPNNARHYLKPNLSVHRGGCVLMRIWCYETPQSFTK